MRQQGYTQINAGGAGDVVHAKSVVRKICAGQLALGAIDAVRFSALSP